MPTIGILIFPDAEELDFAGPWEVLAAAAELRGRGRVLLLGEDLGPVRCAKGLRVLPDCRWTEAPELDVILVPGGDGRRRLMKHGPLLDFLRERGPRARWVTSVCTGAFLLAAAGLATGRELTTHWSCLEELEAWPVRVRRDLRYTVDGPVVSAAGVSAGIDMSLWLLGQLDSPAFARQVQRYIQYDPAPPWGEEG